MAFFLFTLVRIVACQYVIKSDGTRTEYWLLRFPFEFHCGWIIVASAVNCNLLAVKEKASPSALFGMAIASIVYVILAAVFCLYALKRPNLTIPLVLAWATFGIAMELRSPIDSIERNFTESQIATIRVTSAIVCILLVLTTIIRAVWKVKSSRGQPSGSTTGEAQETSMMGVTSDPEGWLR